MILNPLTSPRNSQGGFPETPKTPLSKDYTVSHMQVPIVIYNPLILEYTLKFKLYIPQLRGLWSF